MVSRWLDATEEAAWRSHRRMVTLLEGRLAAELAEGTGLSMADYSVLSNLVESDDRRWRITELAVHMQWSQSRLSHHLKRMEQRRLVERRQVPEDGRGAEVVLTRQGLRAIAAAAPVHFAGVRRHMIDVLSRGDLATLTTISRKVLDHLAAEPADDD